VRSSEVAAVKQTVAEREARIVALDHSLSERSSEVAMLRHAHAVHEAKVSSLKATISALRTSTSWRITAPLRAARRLSARLYYSKLGYPLGLAWRAITTRSRAPLRDWRAERVIATSGLFDKEWYLKNNPDVAARRIDPVRHYVSFGARELRDPSPLFSTRSYLLHNPDVATARMNPLAHFALYGRMERRAGGPADVNDLYGESWPKNPQPANLGARRLQDYPEGLELPATRAAPPQDGISWLRPVVMIIDTIYPRPDQDSGSVDAVNFVRIFRDLGTKSPLQQTQSFQRHRLTALALNRWA
jgi:hypothetical protein